MHKLTLHDQAPCRLYCLLSFAPVGGDRGLSGDFFRVILDDVAYHLSMQPHPISACSLVAQGRSLRR